MKKHLCILLATLLQKSEDNNDNKGIDYKINTNPNWEGTVGLRFNHVAIQSVCRYLDIVVWDLSTNGMSAILSYASISRAFKLNPTTNRKRPAPHERTLYVTLDLPPEMFDELRTSLPDAVENYRPLVGLIQKLKD